MPSNAAQVNGVFGVSKPEGITSQGALNLVKRSLGVKKVGHAGTLDPIATGVLVVATGRLTRLLRYSIGDNKRYLATMQLGVRTDSGDRTGEVIASREVDGRARERLAEVVASYLGSYDQVPPKYSARKVGGRRAYALARAGVDVTLEPRRVTVESIRVVDVDGDLVVIDVQCSSGTYIRSLIDDIGEDLGTGATMTALSRTAVGAVELSACHDPSDLSAGATLPFERCFPDWSPIVIDDPVMLGALRHGRGLSVSQVPSATGAERYAVFSSPELLWADLVGMYRMEGEAVVPDLVIGAAQ
jgi:tRNA pseudouridine55 synthase